jgi:hypothetical protein
MAAGTRGPVEHDHAIETTIAPTKTRLMRTTVPSVQIHIIVRSTSWEVTDRTMNAHMGGGADRSTDEVNPVPLIGNDYCP